MARKGIHPLAFVGGGCLVIIVIGVIVIAALFKKGKDLAKDFADNPGKAIAEMAVRSDPNLELKSTDDAKGTITYFDKKQNEEITVDWSKFKEGGELVVKKGDEATTVKVGEGSATVTGPDGTSKIEVDAGGAKITQPGGTTVIGGSEALKTLPSWVPVPKDLSDLQSVTYQEGAQGVTGVFTGKSGKSADDLLSGYKKGLEAVNYEEKSLVTNKAGTQTRTLASFENVPKGRSIKLVILESGGECQVTISYKQKNK